MRPLSGAMLLGLIGCQSEPTAPDAPDTETEADLDSGGFPETPPTPQPPPPETLGVVALTSSFVALDLPDGTQRRFHLGDALTAFHANLPFAADFDGDGLHSIGVLDADGTLRFGPDNAKGLLPEARTLDPDRHPVAGDFNGSGADGLGVYDPTTGTLALWQGLPDGPAAHTLQLPADAWVIACDLDGDHTDGIAALTDDGTFTIIEPLDATPRELSTGLRGFPVAGDLDGDGRDTLGVYQANGELAWVDAQGAVTSEEPLGNQTFQQWPVAGRWSTTGVLDEHEGYAWPTADATAAGFDTTLLDQGSAAIEATGLANALLVVHDGVLVHERYWRGFDASMANGIKSVSKSIVSAMIGVLHRQGQLTAASPLAELLPDGTFDPGDPKADIPLSAVMSMSAGLAWDEATDLRLMALSDDWPAAVLSRPSLYAPGTVYGYSTGLTHVGSLIVDTVADESPATFAQRELFDPLGIAPTRWDHDPDGLSMGGAEMWMRPRDLARFGQLYLDGGVLDDGTTVLDPDWVAATFTPRIGTYGLWWRRWTLAGSEAWVALGHGGQVVAVVPSKQLVVVVTSEWTAGAAQSDGQIDALYAALDTGVVAAGP